jgi:ribosomal protein S18 acetylase RimI-like enzyme
VSVREDAWLSLVLGQQAFAVEDGSVPDELAPGFWYAKVDVGDVGRVRELSQRGFAVVDVNVTLVRRGTVPRRPRRVPVEVARPEQHSDLLDIAGSCFRYSRFHLDPAFSRETADRVKREWVRSYVDGERGLELLAALSSGRPVGFLAVLEVGNVRVIDLVGVSADVQRQGVGSALVAAFVERHGPKASLLRVGTQIANVPSLHLYSRFGFEVSSAAYVLHRHAEAA